MYARNIGLLVSIVGISHTMVPLYPLYSGEGRSFRANEVYLDVHDPLNGGVDIELASEFASLILNTVCLTPTLSYTVFDYFDHAEL